jgi:hypothetical protein
VKVVKNSLTKHLAAQLVRENKIEGEALSPCEQRIVDIESENNVGAVIDGASGRHAGYYEENGCKVLVTGSPTVITPRKGDWSYIEAVLKHRFREAPEQIDYEKAYWAEKAKCFHNGGKRQAKPFQGQMLNYVGVSNSLKSAMLVLLYSPILGGRHAKADPLFSKNGSDFNSESFSSEVIYLDDTDVLGSDHASRARSGKIMNDITVGQGNAHHGKNHDKVNIKPWQVLVRCMNMELDTLATLPTGEEGYESKYIVFLCSSMEGGPVDTTKPGWYEVFAKKMASQRAAYLYHLLYEYETPDHVLDPDHRYAVASYKNPTVMALLNEGSTEEGVFRLTQKLNYFDGGLYDDDLPKWWQGTSAELYDLMCEQGSISAQQRFRKMCCCPRVLASQLKIIKNNLHPHSVFYSNDGDIGAKKTDGLHTWRIMSPRHTLPEADDCF